MLKPSPKGRMAILGLLILLLLQSCRMRSGFAPQIPVAEEINTASTQTIETLVVPTRKAGTPTPFPIEVSPTSTASLRVTITAVKGNLFIRRGPDLAYNSIGVLYKDAAADVVARDVLSKWAQIVIPDSNDLGWVSLQTRYSSLDGDFQSLPDLTPTDWPVPAYLRNCTYHQMIVQPGEIVLPSLFEVPENEVWVYPGSYRVYDLDHPDEPEVAVVELREGLEIDIRVDGNGEKRKCP